jgi:hypothetical protein
MAELKVFSIFAGAFRLYRASPARVAGASLIVLLPLMLAGEAFHELEQSLPHDVSHGLPFLLVILPSMTEMLALLGSVVLGGTMNELVGPLIRGADQPSVGEAVRSLPIGRLVAADLVVTFLVGVGAAVGAVPGLLMAALVSIVGPVVHIERLSPLMGVRRSIGLTWPHAWLAICLVVPAILVEGVAHGFLVFLWDRLGLVGELAVEIPLILSVGAFVVLTEVVLAYALLARDPGSSVARAVGKQSAETAG